MRGHAKGRRGGAARAAGLLLATLAGSCLAAETGGPDASDAARFWAQQIENLPRRQTEPGKAWWEEVKKALPGCGEYTDGCRICLERTGEVVCSTPGIACTPSAWTCGRPR